MWMRLLLYGGYSEEKVSKIPVNILLNMLSRQSSVDFNFNFNQLSFSFDLNMTVTQRLKLNYLNIIDSIFCFLM